MMIKKPFEQWLFEEVELTFGIEPIEDMPTLQRWLSINNVDKIPNSIEELRLLLLRNVTTWNEDELKMLFIAPFLTYFKYNNAPHYRVFTQRKMSLITEKVEAHGRVEWMLASGKQIPRKPFFFLQEYKPEKTTGNDPLGQLLIAMIDAQRLNNTPKKPLYGCYIIGRLWFFIVLEDKKYGVSKAYDATQTDDLEAMIIILKRVKKYIHKVLNLAFKD